MRTAAGSAVLFAGARVPSIVGGAPCRRTPTGHVCNTWKQVGRKLECGHGHVMDGRTGSRTLVGAREASRVPPGFSPCLGLLFAG